MKKLFLVTALLIAVIPAIFAAGELQKVFKKPQATGTVVMQSVPKKDLPPYLKSMKVLVGQSMEDGIKIVQATENIPSEIECEEENQGDYTIKAWYEYGQDGKPGYSLCLITGMGQAMMMLAQGDIEAMKNDTTFSNAPLP